MDKVAKPGETWTLKKRDGSTIVLTLGIVDYSGHGAHEWLSVDTGARYEGQDLVGLVKQMGAHGWPLVPSKAFPGELTLACPKCGGTEILLTGSYGFPGTGPNGRGRLGDRGGLDVIRCETCKHEHTKPSRAL
jgi:hypothetical protein